VLAVLAALLWLPAALRRATDRGAPAAGAALPADALSAGPVPGPLRALVRVRPARTRLGWAMAVYFGCQSLGAYAVMGWLAQLFRDAGFAPATAGLLLALITAVGVPVAFLVPSLAIRVRDLRLLILGLPAASVAGYLGLALAPAGAAVLWVLLIAAGQASFPLVLTMLGLRARTPEGIVALSAFAQSTGYLFAGLGPLLVGVLYDATGGWTVPLALLIAVVGGQVVAGLVAARPRHIEDQ
jgi:CP family cyanate transporter-like MFS transporter